MTLTSAGNYVRNLAVLEEKTRWVRCPFCDDEVTKLKPCTYWDPKQVTSHVCFECGESVKGLTYMAGQFPILGVDVIRELRPAYRNLPAGYQETERAWQAQVVYGEWSFLVWPEASRLFVLEGMKPPDTKKSYDNTFQVWFAIKKQFEEGRKEELTIHKRGGDRRSGWKV